MNKSEGDNFTKIMDSTCETYQRPPLSEDAIMVYFTCLCEFSLDQISKAIFSHMRKNKFMPRPSDIVDNIQGSEELSTDQVIAAARAKSSPFGILCAIKIGSSDLKGMNTFDLKPRAQECIDLISEWKAMHTEGRHSDHQLSVMKVNKVHPCHKFFGGIDEHGDNKKLAHRFAQIGKTSAFLRLTAPTSEPLPELSQSETEACQKRLRGLLDGI